MAVMGRSRFDLLTYGALISLFFATMPSRASGRRSTCLSPEREALLLREPAESALFVILSAVGVLV